MAAEPNIPPVEDRDPVPGIPAGEGWKQMRSMLDKAMPTREPAIASPLRKKVILYIGVLVASLVAIALLIYRTSPGSLPAANRFQKKNTLMTVSQAEKHSIANTEKKKKTATLQKKKSPEENLLKSKEPYTADNHQHDVPSVKDNKISAKEKRVITKNTTGEQWRKKETLPFVITDLQSTPDTPYTDHTTFIYATIASERTNTDLLITKVTDSLPETDSSLAAHLADSISNSAGNKKTTDKKRTENVFKGGIQFLGAVPVNGSAYYFSGPSGAAQAYRLFAPSLWMSYAWRKSFFTLSLVPFMQNNLPDDYFRKVFRGAAPNALSDTSLTLLKYFGTGGAISFGKRIGTHLQISAGVEIAAWSKGLIKWERSGPSSAGVPYAVKKDTLYSISSQDTLWKYMNSMQPGAMFEILYQKNKWQAGAKINIPLKKPINTGNTGAPLQLNLFYRYTLFRKTK